MLTLLQTWLQAEALGPKVSIYNLGDMTQPATLPHLSSCDLPPRKTPHIMVWGHSDTMVTLLLIQSVSGTRRDSHYGGHQQ